MNRSALVALVIVVVLCGCAGKAPALTAQDAIDAFISAGLEAEGYRAMTKDDYGMAPMLATDGIRFLIPSLCPECGGRVLTFDSAQDLKETQAFYVDLGEQSAMFFSWVFVKNNLLVQISGDLSEDKAAQYEAVLAAIGE